MMIVLSSVSMIVLCMEARQACMEEKEPCVEEGTWKAIDRCRDNWKDGGRILEGSVVVLSNFILLSLLSVS